MGLMMLKALARYWKLLAGAAVALIFVSAVLMYGKSKYDEGVNDERAKQAAQAIAAAEGRNEVDDAIGRLPDGGAADELRKHWSRD